MRVVIAVLALALCGGIGLVVLGVKGDEAQETPSAPRDRQEVNVPAEVQADLAARFRPILLFDSSEPWRPLNIKRFLAEGGGGSSAAHQLCDTAQHPGSQCRALTGAADFDQLIRSYSERGQGLYLDLAGDSRNGTDYVMPTPGCELEPPARDCDGGAESAIYYNVKGVGGRYYIDYWWFMRFNDFEEDRGVLASIASCNPRFRPYCSDHEGDWEGVTVVTTTEDPDTIEYVAFAAHESNPKYASSQIEIEQGSPNPRPHVYVARGTHAAYPTGCSSPACRQLATTLGKRRPEGRYDGDAPWARNSGEACQADPGRDLPPCLLPLPSTDRDASPVWNAYAGFWGRPCRAGEQGRCHLTLGPRSPGSQQRYKYPWCAQLVSADSGGLGPESCDAAAPGTESEAQPGVPSLADCDAWAGISVAISACDAATLAEAAADPNATAESTISIEIEGSEQEQTLTPGLAQVVGEAIRAPRDITVEGRVTNLLVRARPPADRSGRQVEVRFAGIGLQPGERAEIRVRYKRGRVRVTLVLPSGETRRPTRIV